MKRVSWRRGAAWVGGGGRGLPCLDDSCYVSVFLAKRARELVQREGILTNLAHDAAGG